MARTFQKTSSAYLTGPGAGVRKAPLTMAGFIRVDALEFHAAISLDNGGSHAFFLGVNNSGNAQAQINAPGAGGFAQANSSGAVEAQRWHHIAAVYRNASLREAWVDGGGKGVDTTTAVPADATRTELGRIAGFATYLSGGLAEAAIWDCGLSESELGALARGRSPALVRPGALVFYAPLVGREDFDIARGLVLTPGAGGPGVSGHPRVVASPAIALQRPGRVLFDQVHASEAARRRLAVAAASSAPALRTVVLDDAVLRLSL